jgi:hypothetical protein
MSSLTEEDPEYPTKVKAFLEKRHLRRLPWGFIVAHNTMVATTTTDQRRERGFVGETAIRLLRILGVDESNLEQIDSMADTLTDKELLETTYLTPQVVPEVKLVPSSVPAAELPAPSDPVPGT